MVKEARLGALPDKNESIYRAWNLKKNETTILRNNKIRTLINMPKYIDQLYIDESFYIVEEKIDGLSLRELLQQNSMLNKNQSKNKKLDLDNDLINIWRQILTFITRLHSSGYVLNDISDDNFIYNRQTKEIALVDVETIQPQKKNCYSEIATNNFCIRMPLNLDDYNKDCYKLSLLMFY
ncbi:MAG: serine/threonine-protein kinase, partial [Lactococcus lactis]|nr:serine/threonine-protein kinase [Lactococcus lactis]